MNIPLHSIAARFCENWGPKEDADPGYHRFVDDLRELLEAYGVAALMHQSLPDTEHEHGEALNPAGRAVQIGKYKIEPRDAAGAPPPPRAIWIEHVSGPSAGEGGEFDEEDFEKSIDDFYRTRF